MIETQLLRSANGPLDVYWEELDSDDGSPDVRCAELVLAHCTRWRSLHLRLSAGTEAGPSWLVPAAGRFDALEKLTVLGQDYTGTLERIFTVAPRLQEVFLTDSATGDVFRFSDCPSVGTNHALPRNVQSTAAHRDSQADTEPAAVLGQLKAPCRLPPRGQLARSPPAAASSLHRAA
ncbi:hypothetical protein MSAN_00530800 [Mycena sanguinolenta]|uniref:Uncharacterized protein n=1 Tax=Mycena sanguinolenta TaxID=230812 RepID=A0A8H6ZCL6_9AGAR|nr:hypothetical protein MSAN_00530800 [Mycena sanguinolenta]